MYDDEVSFERPSPDTREDLSLDLIVSLQFNNNQLTYSAIPQLRQPQQRHRNATQPRQRQLELAVRVLTCGSKSVLDGGGAVQPQQHAVDV